MQGGTVFTCCAFSPGCKDDTMKCTRFPNEEQLNHRWNRCSAQRCKASASPTRKVWANSHTDAVSELSYRCMRCPKTATTPNAFDTMSQSMLPPAGLLCALNARVWSAVLRCSLGHHGEATPDLESAP